MPSVWTDRKVANEKILKVNEQKFQCQVCSKLFKGQDYVFKHIYRTHPKILDDVRDEQHQEAAQSAFLADPNRPPASALWDEAVTMIKLCETRKLVGKV